MEDLWPNLVWPMEDLWPKQCITFRSRVVSTKVGSHIAFLSSLISGWPGWPLPWPLTPTINFTLVMGSSYWLGWHLNDLWTQRCITLWSGALSNQIWWLQGILKRCDPWLTPGDLCMTFDPRSKLCSAQRFFWPTLVAIRHFRCSLTSGCPSTFDGVASKICFKTLGAPLPHAKFQLSTSKHDEMHSQT